MYDALAVTKGPHPVHGKTYRKPSRVSGSIGKASAGIEKEHQRINGSQADHGIQYPDQAKAKRLAEERRQAGQRAIIRYCAPRHRPPRCRSNGLSDFRIDGKNRR